MLHRIASRHQVYLAAVRNFSHRGLEGGDRLLSITTRDGRFVHFRMPASASAARCAAWFEAECPQQQQRRRRGGVGGQASSSSGSGREELWKRGLWGAGSSELWMERLVDEVRGSCVGFTGVVAFRVFSRRVLVVFMFAQRREPCKHTTWGVVNDPPCPNSPPTPLRLSL